MLSMLCYNFGVEAFELHDFQECVFWLRESYEIGKDRVEIGPKNQVSTEAIVISYQLWYFFLYRYDVEMFYIFTWRRFFEFKDM